MRKVQAVAWALAAATSLAAVPLAGSPAVPSSTPIHHRAAGVDPQRAAELRARATELAKTRAHFRAAAELYEEASALTPVEEADRAHDLYLAGNLLYFIGSEAGAEADMGRSADAALERGDVVAAADALMSAAWLAGKRRQAGQAREYALRALHLAASPLLSDELRDRIRQRVVVTPIARNAPGVEGRQASRTGWSVASQNARAGARRRSVKAGTTGTPGR